MPGHRDKLNGLPDIRVVIRNSQGKYLAQDAYGLFFTEERSAAIVLNYQLDRVPEQLETIQQKHGMALAAEPLPAEEIYEKCDGCQELFMPFMTYFDGSGSFARIVASGPRPAPAALDAFRRRVEQRRFWG